MDAYGRHACHAHGLEEAGFDRSQAEAVAQAVEATSASTLASIREEMVTKPEFKGGLAEVKGGIAVLGGRLTGVETDAADIKTRLAGVEGRLMILEATPTGIEARLTSLEAHMKDIKADLAELKIMFSRFETRMMRLGAGLGFTIISLEIVTLLKLYGAL